MSVLECKTEYATVSHAVRFDGDDGIEEQRHALQALLSRCHEQGLHKSAKEEKRHSSAVEQECRASETDSASVSEVQGRGDRFRHGEFCGKAYMTVDDFAVYYAQRRPSTPIASGVPNAKGAVQAKERKDSDAPVRDMSKSPKSKRTRHALSVRKTDSALALLESMAREWLEPNDRVRRDSRRAKPFPLSLVAGFVVIAISLMLLISGSVMVAGVKSDVGELKREVNALSSETALMENQWESELDYLEIYRLATEEYGMIDAQFVQSEYLGAGAENYVEVCETEEKTTTGWATLLAAIGIHLGD